MSFLMIKYGISLILMKQLILLNGVIWLMERMTGAWQHGHEVRDSQGRAKPAKTQLVPSVLV